LSSKKAVASTNSQLLQRILGVLEEEHSLVAEVVDHELTAQEVLGLLADLGRCQADVRELFASLAANLGLPSNGKERILRYLRSRVGQVVDKEALSGVSGIYEWARRVRELRDEEGWPISSNENRPELKPGQYVLEEDRRRPRAQRSKARQPSSFGVGF
jgi:hypothetical protein